MAANTALHLQRNYQSLKAFMPQHAIFVSNKRSLWKHATELTYKGLCEVLVPEETPVSTGPLWLAGSSWVFVNSAEALLRQSDVCSI